MASRRTILTSVSMLALGIAYGLHLVTAQVAPPVLAQSPMNITNTIAPAFLMAVDNSGSMTSDETLFRTDDGTGVIYNYGLFESTGAPIDSSDHKCNGNLCNGYTAITKPMDGGHYADFYGALRGPEYNRAYFNPATTYTPWLNVATDGTITPDANSVTTAAVEDPRGTGVAAAPFSTFNFTTYLTVTETWASGKVMPKGTEYYQDQLCNGKPNNVAASWQTLGADFTFGSNCATQFRYYPARVYLSLTATPPPGFDLTKRVLIKGAGPAGADLYRYDYLASNFTTGGAAAVQNFANWWTYYGNRNRAIIAGMTNSLASINNMRVGYFKITPDGPNAAGESTGTLGARTDVTMRDMNVAADKNKLYTSMRALDSHDTTPTRSATAFMVKQFMRTNAGAPVALECQKNAGMLFTDGFTNEASPYINKYGLTFGNQDGTVSAPYVTGTPYTGGVASSDTIADIAMYGYNTPLRTDTGFNLGKVPVSKICSGPAAQIPAGTDCNTNLHMNFYGVTLGARGQIYDVNAAATANPYANAPNWQATGTTNLKPENVDDIWHAALNSRGEFINAQSPSDITSAMRRILAAVNEGSSPAGTIGVTGARIGTNSLTVQPRYESANNGTDWFSTLTAETVTADPFTGAATFTQAWEASARLALQLPGTRTIKFGQTASSVVPAVSDFSAGNVSLAALCNGTFSLCTAAQLSALATGMDNTQAVAYLRGDRALELTGKLRTRSTLLGDIINSSPVVSAPTDDYGYRALGGTLGTDYATYLATKKAADRPMVYVGANDGMLHAIDGRSSGPGGDEVYAYIPATSLGHMGNLLFPYVVADKDDQKFQHRYYVDGPITVSDVYIGGAWKTVVVGTSGAGGRSVFALDVTNPAAITVLWEVNDLITGNTAISNNIGHVLGKPVIVPVKNSSGTVSWKAIFGNGYNSNNLQARLFVVDIGTGSVATILANEAVSPALPYNGLGNVVAVDRQRLQGSTWVSGRDGYTDTVYGADQNGAVWKFDLPTSSLGLAGNPLFVARDASNNRQTILGGLTVATGTSGGVMVYFGSGSFSFSGDPSNSSQQTLYAVLDRGASVTRSQLLQQTVGTDVGNFRGTSTNDMVVGRRGWYLDLPSEERFIGYPRIESGIVFFPTYQPAGGTTVDCSVNGTNWLYGLNALSGAAALSNVHLNTPTGTSPASATGAVALNTGGTAPVKDVAAMTTPRIKPLGAGATPTDIANALAAKCSMVVRVAGAPPMYLPRPCGRQSWRQVR